MIKRKDACSHFHREDPMFCSCRGVSLSQELCCTQLARLFAREHSNREKRVKCDQGFTVHTCSAIQKSLRRRSSACFVNVRQQRRPEGGSLRVYFQLCVLYIALLGLIVARLLTIRPGLSRFSVARASGSARGCCV